MAPPCCTPFPRFPRSPEEGGAVAEPAAPVPDAITRHEGVLVAGQTLSMALRRLGVSAALIHEIDRGMRELVDFRRAQPGHRYRIEFDSAGEFAGFLYETSALDRYRFEPLRAVAAEAEDVRVPERRYRAFRLDSPIERRETRIAGVVHTSLYDAVEALGESHQLAIDFASVFAWDLDFSRSVRAGDEFRILYERNYMSDGLSDVYLGPGRILAASYSGRDRELYAIYFETEPGRGRYFRPDGGTTERRFLAAPLSYNRITSAYSAGRLHPILKVKRPHNGIDYAAPTGTPVWSVADGTVVHKGWAGGSGRLVKIRHANGYTSYYAHLSGYAVGLQVGQAVRQKQVIGYVGQSGLATGPHVCFRIRKDGRYVDPASINPPRAEPIGSAQWARFSRIRDQRLARLGSFSFVPTDEAL